MIHLSPAHRHLAAVSHHVPAIRVFWWLCFELDPVEYRPVKIHHVAHAIRMKPSTVCRALATLRAQGLIHRNGRIGSHGSYSYRLIPNPQLPN